MTFRLTGTFQLLKRHGRNLTLTKVTGSVYNPATSTVEETTEDYTVRGYFYDSKNINIYNTQVEEGNRRVIFYPYDVLGNVLPKPVVGDRVIGQRDNVSIFRVEEVVSNEKVLVYICRVNE